MIARFISLLAIILMPLAIGACDTQSVNHHVPEFKKTESLAIRLSRTQCYGHCPEYDVVIYGTGKVEFCGGSFVQEAGRHEKYISVDEVERLYDFIIQSGFNNLNEEYLASVTDNPSHFIEVSNEGYKKSVLEYAGRYADAPKVVFAIQKAIDDTANTSEWLGTPDLSEGYHKITATKQSCLRTDTRSQLFDIESAK